MSRALIAILGTLLALPSAPLYAQWLSYPTPGLPRTADGKPNLTAPVPRTEDGKPDLSGLWEGQQHGGGSLMSDIAKNVKGGLPFQPWAADLLKARLANEDKDDPDGYCQPLGLVRMHVHPYPRKIIQLPSELVIMFERDNTFRQIFTDGRPTPPQHPIRETSQKPPSDPSSEGGFSHGRSRVLPDPHHAPAS